MNILPLTQQAVARADQAVRRHPRRVSAVAMVLLLGTAVTAFGLAAPLAPADDQPVPTRIVTDTVSSADLSQQLALLDARTLTLSAQTLTRNGDTVDSLLARLGISDAGAAAFLRKDVQSRRILQGRSGKSVHARFEQGAAGLTRLESLSVRGPAMSAEQVETHYTRIAITRVGTPSVSTTQVSTKPVATTRNDEQWQASTEQRPLDSQTAMASGYIQTNLFAAADDARVPEAVVLQLADIFGSDIDFRRELRRGDQFAIVYETPTADGQPVSWAGAAGRVLAARFVNQGHVHEALWFQDGNDRGAYFGPDGRNKARAFLASPLAFSRISSGFAMRMHPIHHTWRAHLGVDYAAASGTPVRVISDGTVEYAGTQAGYGNVVIVRHGSTRSTLYAHLSRVGVRQGQHVAQGQTVGLVGSTGWATGPHLHFEFKFDGRQMDPVKMARTSEARTLSQSGRRSFELQLRDSQSQLAAAELPPIDSIRLAHME